MTWAMPHTINLSKIPKLLETQPTLTEFPLPSGEQEWPKDQLPSELNLMNIRGSISIPPGSPLTASAIALGEMEQLVAQTEESAMQARRVADMAANMLKQMKNFGSMRDGSLGGEGTPVDADHAPLCPIVALHSSPEPEEERPTNQCPEQSPKQPKRSPIGQSKECPEQSSKDEPKEAKDSGCPTGQPTEDGCPTGQPTEDGCPTGQPTEDGSCQRNKLSVSNSSSSSGTKACSESQSHNSKCILM